MSTFAVDARTVQADVERYVRIETPSGDARGLDALHAELAADWARLGARVRAEPAAQGAHLVAELDGTDGRDAAPVLLLGHHDTVWPAGTLDGEVPLRERDGVLHGPGVYDMKGGLAVALAAVRALRESGRPHRPVRLLVVADEEVGSPTARELVRTLAAPCAAVLGFEPPHPGGALKTARWGSTRVRLRCTGRESHAALAPDDGVSAVDELVDQLRAVRALTSGRDDTLANAGPLGGGGRTNVVAGEAWCDLGLRFATPEAETAVMDRLARLRPVRPGARVHAEVLGARPPWATTAATEDLLARAAEAGAACGRPVTGRPARGGADTNLVGGLGVGVLDGFGPVGRGAHAPDEQIVLSSLGERATLVAELLSRL